MIKVREEAWDGGWTPSLSGLNMIQATQRTNPLAWQIPRADGAALIFILNWGKNDTPPFPRSQWVWAPLPPAVSKDGKRMTTSWQEISVLETGLVWTVTCHMSLWHVGQAVTVTEVD